MKTDNRGGKRKGAGRKSKADEAKANVLFLRALKEIYKKDADDDAKVAFIVDLADSQRGQIFIAEHVFGKAKDVVENTNVNYNESLTNEEITLLKKAFLDKY